MKLSGVHAQRWRLGAIAATLLVALCVAGLKPMLENALRGRIEAAALRHGVSARLSAVHVGLWPLLRLEGVDLDFGHGLHFQSGAIEATWAGRPRLSVRDALFTGPAGLRVAARRTTWRVEGVLGDAPQLALVEPQGGLVLRRVADPSGTAWHIEAHGLATGALFDVRRDELPLFDGGIADGLLDVQSGAEALRFRADVGLRGVRVGALADNATDDPQLGEPTDVMLQFAGDWQHKVGRIDIPELQATLAGAALTGSLALTDLDAEPAIDLVLGVKRLDFAQLMGASGLEVPESLGFARGGSHDLGSAALDVQVRGRLADPASFVVSQKIAFTPPREIPPGITRLRGDFAFNPPAGTGQGSPLDVSPTSPDFIALRDVPPLFLRTLLLAEDAGFYGHRGIDLREMPSALITNWSRGGAARGASTITQQLAKNLFLSRDKQVGRKLQELAITFLLESTLGKERILEIYLNIIEWGPELRGLRPAARHYFGREPRALTPAQMAFLVSIIPGPILYQRSLSDGVPGPGLRTLVDNLLAKLRSVDAIGEEDYQQALADPLSLSP